MSTADDDMKDKHGIQERPMNLPQHLQALVILKNLKEGDVVTEAALLALRQFFGTIFDSMKPQSLNIVTLDLDKPSELPEA